MIRSSRSLMYLFEVWVNPDHGCFCVEFQETYLHYANKLITKPECYEVCNNLRMVTLYQSLVKMKEIAYSEKMKYLSNLSMTSTELGKTSKSKQKFAALPKRFCRFAVRLHLKWKNSIFICVIKFAKIKTFCVSSTFEFILKFRATTSKWICFGAKVGVDWIYIRTFWTLGSKAEFVYRLITQ